MHTTVFQIAIVWLVLLLFVNIVQIFRKHDAIQTVLAVDASTILVVAAFAILALHSGQTYYLDPALVVALLSFAETLVAVRFLAAGGVFK